TEDRRALSEGGDVADVFTHRTVTDGRHPCEKPVGLMLDILAAIGGEYRTVADPFMGSGTTGEACLKLGKEFTGSEEDPTHYATALARLRHASGRAADQLFTVLEDGTC